VLIGNGMALAVRSWKKLLKLAAEKYDYALFFGDEPYGNYIGLCCHL